MVRKGEYLERAVVFEGEAGPIEGLYHRGTKGPPLLILPPDPMHGGAMEVAIVAEIAYAVTRRGHATLRINYRGVGASGGTFDGASGALFDARRAVEHLRATAGRTELAILGIGLGATIAAQIAAQIAEDAPEAVPLLVLVAPDPKALPEKTLNKTGEVVAIVAEDEDAALKGELRAWCDARDGVRMVVIPGADRRFFKGLVELGRVVAEALAPPGMLDLE